MNFQHGKWSLWREHHLLFLRDEKVKGLLTFSNPDEVVKHLYDTKDKGAAKALERHLAAEDREGAAPRHKWHTPLREPRLKSGDLAYLDGAMEPVKVKLLRIYPRPGREADWGKEVEPHTDTAVDIEVVESKSIYREGERGTAPSSWVFPLKHGHVSGLGFSRYHSYLLQVDEEPT